MKFHTITNNGLEVLFVGHEGGNSRPAGAWLASGRWRISLPALDGYLTEGLAGQSFGESIDRFDFCFHIGNFEDWEPAIEPTFVTYRPKHKQILSSGQARWRDVRDLAASEQLQVLRGAVQTAINRIGTMKRKPKDFAYVAFASAVDALLEKAPLDLLTAKPAVDIAS